MRYPQTTEIVVHVTFLNLGDEEDAFYGRLTAFMRSAAENLGIHLEIVHCHRDSTRLLEEGEALVRRDAPPEYLVLPNHQGLAVHLIPKADRKGIKTFLLNEGLRTAERSLLGRPREKHADWLGEFLPDDELAGYLLAEQLIADARQQERFGDDGKIHVNCLTGGFNIASVSRVTGLRTLVMEHDDVELSGFLPANWDQEKAKALTTEALARDPQITVLWAASDLMALGAEEAIRAAGKQPGDEVLLGGVDWASFVPERIRSGALSASVGGHFLDGAWALVALHELHHGILPAHRQMESKPVVLTQDTLETYAFLFDDKAWEAIDFARFSRGANPNAEQYDLTLDALVA